MQARPGCVLVAVRDYTQMDHLKNILTKTNLRRHDIVVSTVRLITAGEGGYDLPDHQLFASYEQELFSRVVVMAEKEGKAVDLLVIPGIDPFDALVQTAARLKASKLVTGVSARMSADDLALRIGQAWERLPHPRHPFSLEIITVGRPSAFINLGPHPPRLWPEDVDRLHEMWLTVHKRSDREMHHRDIVGLALLRLERELTATASDEELRAILDEWHADAGPGTVVT